MVNGVPREVPRTKAEGPQAPRVLAPGLPRGTPFTTLHPRLFHIMSFFGHPGLVKRDHFRQLCVIFGNHFLTISDHRGEKNITMLACLVFVWTF